MEELLKELSETIQKIADIGQKIKEKKVEAGRWKPEEGDIYWFIDSSGQAIKDRWTSHHYDRERYEIGNCYKTEAEAESAKEKLKVIAELKEYAEPKNSVWDGVITNDS